MECEIIYSLVFLIEFIICCFLINKKRIKKYWDMFLGINVSYYIMGIGLLVFTLTFKEGWHILMGIGAIASIITSFLLLIIALLNKSAVNVKTSSKRFLITLVVNIILLLSVSIIVLSGVIE